MEGHASAQSEADGRGMENPNDLQEVDERQQQNGQMTTCFPNDGQLRLHEADLELWPWLERGRDSSCPTPQGREYEKKIWR